jgi:hypothetical protein
MSGTRADGIPVVCAEPSPDALSAYGSSLAGSANSERVQAQLAAAIAEQSGSIGLRTQSITLMRDALYRVCEGFRSSAITDEQYYLLQRRFQNLTMGLLAVEQLTGTVKAQQIALSTSGGAATGDNSQAETEALTSAKTQQISAREAHESAKLQLENDRAAHLKATSDVAAAKKALGTDPEKQTQELKDQLASAEQVQKAAQNKLAQQNLDTDTKRQLLAAATESVGVAEENLTLARQRVRAYASGTAQFGPGGGGAQAAATDAVAKAVHGIVTEVLRASNRDEVCNEVMRDAIRNRGNYVKDTPQGDLLASCAYEKAVDAAQKDPAGDKAQSTTKRSLLIPQLRSLSIQPAPLDPEPPAQPRNQATPQGEKK